MGLLFSCSDDDCGSLEDRFESLLMQSVTLQDDSNPKLIIKTSLSFKRKRDSGSLEFETTISVSNSGKESYSKSRFGPKVELQEVELHSPKHRAALKLQKVYKSFRTRRQLADCAVLVKQKWWKLLDFALLKRSSVSFFDFEKPESVVSKWSRARTRAAKVGKGLSKDDKAQKLALQHWLEAIDPRHRYGHNLHYYYDSWLHCESKQPFFYWLDVGEGKDVNFDEKCTRSKLQQQCIKYLGPKEREDYEIIVDKGKLMYKKTGQILDTMIGIKDAKWIFVLSTSKILYVGKKKKGTFQHSSFLAGGATSAAGRLVVENGTLKAVWPHSGHYRPTEENFQEFMSFLKENNVDLTNVKLSPTEDDDDEHWSKLKPNHSELKVISKNNLSFSKLGEEKNISSEKENKDVIEISNKTLALKSDSFGSDLNNSEKILMLHKENLFDEEAELRGESESVSVPKEEILNRINLKKETKSYQLGRQLSCKWSTGAGPRIGCVRDYPAELQHRSLEQMSLSPRGNLGPARFSNILV